MWLSLELSTSQASIALLDEHGGLIARRGWEEVNARHAALFTEVDTLLKETDASWDNVRGVVAGRGPGAFSGLRIGLLAAQGFAAPGRLPVVAVSSAEALGEAETRLRGVPEVLVIGDARRHHLWAGVVHRDRDLDQPVAWTLYPRDALSPLAELAATRPVISSHLASIGDLPFPAEAAWPTAEATGHLAIRNFARNAPLEPCLPIYLHPAV